MKPESKWIQFLETDSKPKTKVWSVITNDGLEILGEVKWFGRWRQYAFFPSAETVYERQCLRNIADFCEARSKEHRKAKTGGR